jgi:predicted lipoprotein
MLVAVALLAYKSVYFEKLSTRKNKNATAVFDANAFGRQLWNNGMPAKIDSAILLATLIEAVSNQGEAGINRFTNALAIGNYRYALVKINATVAEVNEDEVMLDVVNGDSTLRLHLATEFVYGNAIRDASTLVVVKDFPNTNDLNGVSEALNRIIRAEVLPSFKSTVKKGDPVTLVGAVEINKEHIHWQGLEVLPVRIQIKR